MYQYRWEEDEVSGPLVRKLLAADEYSSWETRAFLRPIFRWMKMGLHKDGSREDAAIERAFAFVEWLVQLATQGDAERAIPQLPMLQPSYALNTIVTASQRAGSVREARRAFDLLETHGYLPDVFTYTALIDVIARNGDLPAAIEKYEEMRLSTSKPNIVTYTTLIRAVGLSDKVEMDQCLVFLTHAQTDGAFDEALFLEALEACARRKDRAVAASVLKEIATHSPKLRSDDRFFYTVGQVTKLLDYDGLEPVLDEWVENSVLSSEERVRTSQSVRKAVVHHDINRLISRIQSGSIVTVNDFETLIHQCRKRKWKEDVSVIVDAMRSIATKGWQSTGGEDNNGELIPPQPQLQLTSKTYVAIVDAYMCCGDEPLAWKVVQEVEDLQNISREFALYRKFVRGAYLMTNCDHIAELIALARKDKVVFSQRMGVEVARMHGYRHTEGFDLLVHELPVGETGTKAKKQAYLEELVKSCAYKNNSVGVEETLAAMLKHGFQRSAATETALFMCCIQHDTVSEAQKMLQHFQEASLMIPVPVYDSLLREFYFKYTRRGNTFDESSRKVAMKTLYARRAIFDQVLTTSRDKDSKNAAEQSIRDALMITPDPCLFLLQSVVSLRFLDLTFRTLGKLAKQLLVVVTDELPMEERHAEYCVSQLPLLSVHIVKELDDVVYLHRSHRAELLTFCQDALETDSVDKTMGFIMRRPELYDAETAVFLGPKFAEMFVFGGVSNVLMFFKSDIENSLEMRRQFVREVIELENAAAEEEGEEDSCSFTYTYKAIREFKLEHEAEFMPYMMQARAAMPKSVFADASATPVDDAAYLKIPLAPDHVVVVDSDEALALATDLLMRDSVTRLGLDAEWRPDSRAAVPSKCSILQVACDDYVFIFDFVEMTLGDLEELFEHLFSSEKIAKIGFAIDGDIKRLRWSFPDVKCFDTFANVLDFSFETLEPTTHLADGTYIKQALGFPLSKLQQKSDWERRPLTPQQVAYAALDAYCLLMLQDAVANFSVTLGQIPTCYLEVPAPMSATPAQVLQDVRFEERLAEVETRLPAVLAMATEGSLAKRNQSRRKLYHDSELLRIELEERMNALGIEAQWLSAPEMQDANAKLDAVRKQLKLDVLPASASPLETLYMVVRMLTMALVLVGWLSCVPVLIPLKWLTPMLTKLGVKKNYLPMDIVSWGTAAMVCVTACTDVKAEGVENLLNLKDSVVCMFSHSSNLDGFIVNGSSPVAFKFAAKKSIFLVPFLGWTSRWAFDFVAIDRSHRSSALKSLKELAVSVNERGNSVCISPEGTRSKDGLLQEFKKGPFYLREDTKKNVVPSIVFGAYELWPPGRLFSIPGHTLVRYLPEYKSDPNLNRNQNRLALRRIYLKAFTEDVPDYIGTRVSTNFILKNMFYHYLAWAITFKVTAWAFAAISSVCFWLNITYSTFMLLSLMVTVAGEALMFFTC
ncbi:hypothetical protein PHMEG_0002079 [Phytophthora megakarya]|uniref:Phospholipid/glycerol acyltransferase domain-containing protein n=1 Tax=Phytophthora megakarya TaxID=4795 RepID=A0A225X182_9STRA|nr:hypothetical protein PHMEG_0002079 [Phytophthora megakarya]